MLPPRLLPRQIIRTQAVAGSGQAGGYRIDYRSAPPAPKENAGEDRGMALRRFRDEVYRQLDATPSHFTVEACAVDISEGGFTAMYDEPDYYAQILAQIRKEFSTSYAPRRVRVHIQVGRSFDEYQVHSWASAYAGDYEVYAKHSFYHRTGASTGSVPDAGTRPSAFDIYRDHLQMQFEKLESRPRHAPQPRQKTQSMYEEMGYENPETENHDFHG